MNTRFRLFLTVSLFAVAALSAVRADAQIIASDMTGSMSENLISFSNPSNGAFDSPADGFQKYQRGVSASIPFSVLDDSLVSFPGDALGIIDDNNLDVFFGVTDTENPNNSGAVSATWVFNVAGASDLAVSIDMGAMGDFETSDSFTWTYSIDGGPTMTAFDGVVDDSIDNTYTLAGGAMISLNDPMTVQGAILTNTLQTFSALIAGTGSELTLTLTATTNGGTEAFAFQNIEINNGGVPLQILAFDLLDSASQNLTSFNNPFTDVFTSGADGFQVYQRGASASIPFSVLDDSLMSFPGDSLGIVDDNNLEAFFGVTDTVNSDNSDPVSASWTFDISGGENLGLLIDMGAMGDFEATSDSFTWAYSIDGGPLMTAFESAVDEAASNTYTLAGGAMFTLSDPMTMQGSVLTNVLTRYSTALAGSGSQLVLTLTADTNGGTEAFAFQNIILVEDFQPDVPPPPTVAEIFEIQGNGTASPFDGDMVESLDNIVTALAPDGFFMQTPESRSDGDPDTSDGIFVFTGSAPSVAVGDQVDVVGTIDEFFGFTEFDNDSVVTAEPPVNPVPAAVVFDSTRPSGNPASPSCAIEFECYEGMLIQITDGTVTGPNQRFGTDPLAEVHITAANTRTFREPGVEFPGLSMPPIQTWDGNPEVFELDPNKLGLPNLSIPAGSHFDAVGVIGFEFGGYELWPSEVTVREAVIPSSVRERNRAEFTVGSLNVFRLFDDIDDPEDFTSQGRSRDDAVVSTAEYQTRLEKFAAYIVDVLDAPDILAVQEAEKLGVLEDLAATISARDATVSYSAFLEEGNDVGTIDVGFLVRETVTVEAVTQLGKEEILAFDGSLLNDRPPLLLEGRSTGDGANFPITVIAVHNRSLGGIDGADAARVRQKRFEQAQSLAAKIQDLQVANPDVRLVVTGDFNAFEFTDGLVDVVGHIKGDFVAEENLLSGPDLVEPNLINQSAWVAEDQRYSFIFRGSAQILDHALTSMALDASLRGLEYGRGNADAAVNLIEDVSTPLRSSDHDGLVLYLTRDKDDDGVFDSADQCPGTMVPETPPSRGLGVNRWALIDDDFAFDTVARGNKGATRGFTTSDTGGCSCEQIIDARNLGNGHSKFGCSTGVMNSWVNSISP